ncbi:MAG: ATP-binding protein [Bryobacterales bacterium]|nr:ATP-binding protein [Bryobacterales bacterium]
MSGTLVLYKLAPVITKLVALCIKECLNKDSRIAEMISGLADGYYQNSADRWAHEAVAHSSQMEDGRRPVNHDLARGALRAYLKSTLQMCITLGHRETEKSTKQWLADAAQELRTQLGRTTEPDYIPPPAAADGMETLFLLPGSGTGPAQVSALRAQLVAQLLAERPDAPEIFQEAAKNGWHELYTDRADGVAMVSVDWFELVCAYFSAELRDNPSLANVIQTRILVELESHGIPITLEHIRKTLEGFAPGATAALERVDQKLDQALGGIGSLETRVRALVDTVTVELSALGQWTRAVDGTIDMFRTELRRKPLYEKYGGWEADARASAEIARHGEPFVGRDQELAILSSQVTAPDGRICLFTGPGGFGKSALTARWGMRQQWCYVIYHPFVHGDDVLGSSLGSLRRIVRRLYVYYGIDLERGVPSDLQEVRETIYGLIHEHGGREALPLVILLDGLDEAGQDFSPPFPSPLPANVSIIVTARAADGEHPRYLQAWERSANRYSLDCLPPGAVRQWAAEALSGKVIGDRIADRVAEKSGGYPLYVRFLLEDLAAASSAGGEMDSLLDSTPMDFREYVRMQMKRLAEDPSTLRYRHLFALLAALGAPVPKHVATAISDLDEWSVAGMPGAVRRWIHLSKDEHTGESVKLAHPLLAQEIREWLPGQTLEARERFGRFAAGWDGYEPVTKRFCLRQIPLQLAAAEQHQELLRLASDRRFRMALRETFRDDSDVELRTIQLGASAALDCGAVLEAVSLWFDHSDCRATLSGVSLEDTLCGADWQRAFQGSRRLNPTLRLFARLIAIWRLAQENVPATVLDSAVEQMGDFTAIRVPRGLVPAFVRLVAIFADVRPEVFNSLREVAVFPNARALLARMLWVQDQKEAAIETARRIPAGRRRNMVLRRFISESILSNDPVSAVPLVRLMSASKRRVAAVRETVKSLLAGGHLGKAEHLEAEFPDEVARTDVMVARLELAAASGRFDVLARLRNEAAELQNQDLVNTSLVRLYARNGDYLQARRILDRIHVPLYRASATSTLSTAYHRAGREFFGQHLIAQEIDRGFFGPLNAEKRYNARILLYTLVSNHSTLPDREFDLLAICCDAAPYYVNWLRAGCPDEPATRNLFNEQFQLSLATEGPEKALTRVVDLVERCVKWKFEVHLKNALYLAETMLTYDAPLQAVAGTAAAVARVFRRVRRDELAHGVLAEALRRLSECEGTQSVLSDCLELLESTSIETPIAGEILLAGVRVWDAIPQGERCTRDGLRLGGFLARGRRRVECRKIVESAVGAGRVRSTVHSRRILALAYHSRTSDPDWARRLFLGAIVVERPLTWSWTPVESLYRVAVCEHHRGEAEIAGWIQGLVAELTELVEDDHGILMAKAYNAVLQKQLGMPTWKATTARLLEELTSEQKQAGRWILCRTQVAAVLAGGGMHERAMELLKSTLHLAGELGSYNGTGEALGNMLSYIKENRLLWDLAPELYRKAEEFGVWRHVSRPLLEARYLQPELPSVQMERWISLNPHVRETARCLAHPPLDRSALLDAKWEIPRHVGRSSHDWAFGFLARLQIQSGFAEDAVSTISMLAEHEWKVVPELARQIAARHGFAAIRPLLPVLTLRTDGVFVACSLLAMDNGHLVPRIAEVLFQRAKTMSSRAERETPRVEAQTAE